MKILYISFLPKTMSGGPKYSVPKQVNAQARFDEVAWINMSRWGVEDSEIPCECIPDRDAVMTRIETFSPDLVVFEDLYYLEFYRISLQLRRRRIPYIIIPRGCLTKAAQRQKRYKKLPANLLMFLPMTRHALAIEYLTQKERDTASGIWNKRYIVVPNGTMIPEQKAAPQIDGETLQGTFIGRINPYHKGLDVFFAACEQLKPLLEEKHCRMDFYGPFLKAVGDAVNEDLRSKGLDGIITIHKEIHGAEKDAVLRGSDFFILTSRFEGLPMGLLEALAYGLPSLVTDETNIGEMVAAAGAGYSSKCTAEGIKDNFEKLLTMEAADFSKMSADAIAFAKRFDWVEIARDAHAEYERLLMKG